MEHDALRGTVRRSRLVKLGIAAFIEHEEEIASKKRNQYYLDEADQILNMPKEDTPEILIKSRAVGGGKLPAVDSRPFDDIVPG